MGEYWDAVYTGDIDTLQRLFAAGQDPNETDRGTGAAALHILAQKGLVQAIEATLAANADPEVRDSAGATPLMWSKDPSTARVLLAAGADPNTRDLRQSTPLIEVIVRCRDTGADAALAELAEFLVAEGADAMASDDDGMTALHWAAWTGRIPVMQALVQAGADVNALDSKGFSPLIYAIVANGPDAAAKWLVQNGADPNLKSPTNGVSPMDLARTEGGGYNAARWLLTAKLPAGGRAAAGGGCLLAALATLTLALASGTMMLL